MINNKIIIGSRGSKLAILYAEKARKTIVDYHTNLNRDSINIKIIKTSGDIHHSKRYLKLEERDFFQNKLKKNY